MTLVFYSFLELERSLPIMQTNSEYVHFTFHTSIPRIEKAFKFHRTPMHISNFAIATSL